MNKVLIVLTALFALCAVNAHAWSLPDHGMPHGAITRSSPGADSLVRMGTTSLGGAVLIAHGQDAPKDQRTIAPAKGHDHGNTQHPKSKYDLRDMDQATRKDAHKPGHKHDHSDNHGDAAHHGHSNGDHHDHGSGRADSDDHEHGEGPGGHDHEKEGEYNRLWDVVTLG